MGNFKSIVEVPGYPFPLVLNHATGFYSIQGRGKLRGPSSLVKKFSRPFDANFWSMKTAQKRGVSQQVVLDEWDRKRNESCDRGHRIHSFAEQVANGGGTQSCDGYQSDCGYEMGLIAAYRDLEISPIENEKVICEPNLELICIVDLIARIPQANVIFDWKTNATIDLSSRYGDTMLPPLSHLDDCNFNHYSLQLNTYRTILSRRYDFHADKMILIWLPGDGTYQPLEVSRMDAEVAMMLSAWQRMRQESGE